jgi:hypothetical protein
MDKASLLVWGFVGLAVLAAFGLVLLAAYEVAAERRRPALATDDADIDAKLSRLEREVSTLQDSIDEYPGGPLTIGDGGGDGHER